MDFFYQTDKEEEMKEIAVVRKSKRTRTAFIQNNDNSTSARSSTRNELESP